MEEEGEAMMWKKWGIKAGIFMGYSLLGSLAFYTAFSFFMDWELVKSRVASELGKATGYDVKLASVELSGLSGLTISGITLTEKSPKNPEEPSVIRIEALDLKANVFSMMGSNPSFSFDATMLGGKIAGKVDVGKTSRKLKLELENVKVDKIPGIGSAITLPMTGRLSATGSLEMPPEGMRLADGDFQISCKNCIMGDGKAKVKAAFVATPNNPASAAWAKEGFTLPPLSLGKFSGGVEIKKGKASFKDISAKSVDGEAELSGFITFRTPIKTSTTNLYFKFQFSEEVKKKHPNLEGIELSLQAKGKRSDGFYGLSMTGQLGAMRFLPAKTGVKDFAKTAPDKKAEKDKSNNKDKFNSKDMEPPRIPSGMRRSRSGTPKPDGEK